MTRPAERWLSGDDDDKFAAAMLKCQHPAGFCASDGTCYFGGDCFRSAYSARKEAIRKIQMISVEDTEESAMVRGWLNEAATWLEQQSN